MIKPTVKATRLPINSRFVLFPMQVLVVLATWCLLATPSLAANIDSVRLWRAPDNTRIVFDLSGPIEYSSFSLENPDRLVVDVTRSKMVASINDVGLSGTPIGSIRTGVQNESDLRIVLDLQSKVDPKVFFLPAHGDKSDRLVIDLFDLQARATPTVTTRLELDSSEKREILIAIDAGHGGEDPGAIGPKKVYEKDVVLAISKELASIIDRHPGYRSMLVRTGDYYVPHAKRREIARQQRADLFVSVHADAFKTPSARGASVYALSLHGATSETARYLASRENNADLIGGVGSVRLDDKDEMLAGMLLDLSMTATLSASLEAGDYVLRAIGDMAHLHKRQVEQANFMVLKAPDMPSILVETGFISNPAEAKRLNTASYRKQLAQQIFHGIDSYFRKLAPPGTYIAWQKQTGGGFSEHVISRGETLSGIAKRYNVSISDLQSVNNMSHTQIRVGQRLKIPST